MRGRPHFHMTDDHRCAQAVAVRETAEYAQVKALLAKDVYPLVLEVEADAARRRPEVAVTSAEVC